MPASSPPDLNRDKAARATARRLVARASLHFIVFEDTL